MSISNNKINRLDFFLISIIIPLNLIFDFMTVFYEKSGGFFAVIRGGILISLLLYLSANIFKNNKVSFNILLFVSYVIILLPFSSDYLYSINISTKVIISILMFLIGYNYFNNSTDIEKYYKYFMINYLIFVLNILFVNIFNLGGYTYTDKIDFQAGGYTDNWNILTYLLLIAPVVLLSQRKLFYKIVLFVLFIIITIVLLIAMKRIAITGFVVGYLLIFYFYGEYSKAIKYVFIILISLFLLSPLYLSTLSVVLDARKERLNPESFEEETRYKETIGVWEEILSFRRPLISLFGGEPFNSFANREKTSFGFNSRRQYHVDYNLIASTCGIVGLLLYLNMYYRIFSRYYLIKKAISDKRSKMIGAVFLSLIITSLMTSLAGQMYAVTFRVILFLNAGILLGYINKVYKTNYLKPNNTINERR